MTLPGIPFSFFFFFFWDTVSLPSPSCPETHYVDHTGLELTGNSCFCLQGAMPKGCATMLGHSFLLKDFFFLPSRWDARNEHPSDGRPSIFNKIFDPCHVHKEGTVAMIPEKKPWLPRQTGWSSTMWRGWKLQVGAKSSRLSSALPCHFHGHLCMYPNIVAMR